MFKVAIVDDDLEWGDFCLHLFKEKGYAAVHYPTVGRFFDSLASERPDLLLLDMQLPGMHGREVIRALRGNPETAHLLIVAVSAHDVASQDAVKALEMGADEYMAKPVEENLLLTRLEVLLRRRGEIRTESLPLQVGELVLYPLEHRAMLGGEPLKLSPLEYDLVYYFLTQSGRALPRSLLLSQVWKEEAVGRDLRNVDKQVQVLRRKLGRYGERIETIPGVGYLFRTQGPKEKQR